MRLLNSQVKKSCTNPKFPNLDNQSPIPAAVEAVREQRSHDQAEEWRSVTS